MSTQHQLEINTCTIHDFIFMVYNCDDLFFYKEIKEMTAGFIMVSVKSHISSIIIT